MEYSFEEKMEKHFAKQLKKAKIGVMNVSVGCCDSTMTTRVAVATFNGKYTSGAEFSNQECQKCLDTITDVIVNNSKALVGEGVEIDTYKAQYKDYLVVTVDIERV